ncbi:MULTISPECIES: alpha-L-fucosidase [Asticcacaulis]|uniref:alpha-L-fucosidase n=1 Tax=Asticcacaulis TaxID=76890 RepID=UPI001FD8FA6D|nr:MULTISPECIES: alpha-L-fucosidase [Asticcacaulis]MBP2161189.1 alpha-L-fucosidase [Asticcacaulis solisilvae]MDR6802234.1 alpha-L-fucosidase [Asticcacaulis sp. BE141]
MAAAPSAIWAQSLTDEEKSAAKQSNADPTLAPDLLLPERDMAWWRDAKFGVFVHWGLYAIPAKGEWHMFNDKVPPEAYAKLAHAFNPKHYDPDAWAALARAAGAGYMVMTARHHDGFALWDSPSSYGHFDAIHSGARRDLIAPYVKAVRRAGLRVGIYYSPLDWRFPAYFKPKELPENAQLFKRQTYGQVEELMKNYGKIDVLWWDGGWLAHSGTDADAAWFWEPDKLNRMVRGYQPKILINPRSGWQGDFDISEGGAPITGPIRARPWEKTFSINSAWGYTPEHNVMSWEQVVRLLVDAVVRNGNVLANVGPDRDGVIPPKQAATLRGVGEWLKRYGTAIYGTRPGPFQPVDNVYGATRRGDKIFLHILSWPNDELSLPPIDAKITKVRNLSGDAVDWRLTGDGLTLSVAPKARGVPVTMLELTAQGE